MSQQIKLPTPPPFGPIKGWFTVIKQAMTGNKESFLGRENVQLQRSNTDFYIRMLLGGDRWYSIYAEINIIAARKLAQDLNAMCDAIDAEKLAATLKYETELAEAKAAAANVTSTE